MDLYEILNSGEEDIIEAMVTGAKEKFSTRYDRREGFKHELDFGSVGEDSTGVWTTVHPDVLLSDEPELWSIIHRWNTTSERALDLTKSDQLSNWESQAWLTLLSAQNREEARRLSRDSDG